MLTVCFPLRWLHCRPLLPVALVALPAASGAAQERTGEPVVNAPVAPDTIYVSRFFPTPGVSVIDLNGFGQSTGNPEFDIQYGPGSEGKSTFPWNPNVLLQGSVLIPPLFVGDSTLNGGSSGVFSLTKDSSLDDRVLEPPAIFALRDMMLGHPLDIVFNNALPFGCQSGGGNICATTGLQIVSVEQGGPNTLQPADGAPLHTVVGRGNPISFAPHPNPPPIQDPPLCLEPFIQGQEPTSRDSILNFGLFNLLAPSSNPLGQPDLGIPPQGLLTSEQNTFLTGPSPPQQQIALCNPYQYRQQIGHFLYGVDRARREVVVVNSNTFAVLERIELPNPVELAMGPNLDFLAVSNRATDSVSFIDIDPSSSTFHEVIREVSVGDAPSGIAWDPGNEDILVCNEGDNSVSILSAATLSVRKVVRSGLRRPFAVVITPRQQGFGFGRNVYFAYILDRAGRVSLFESGPGGANGWGYDDIIGRTPFTFPNARTLQPDHIRLTSGVWVVHERKLTSDGRPTGLGGGAVSNLVLDAKTLGQIPIDVQDPPNLRGLSFRIETSIGSDQLTGIPKDIAFDNQRNLGVLPNFTTPFSAGSPAPINGKQLVRATPGGLPTNTNEPTYLFVPVRPGALGTEAVDVISLDTGLRIDTNPFQPGIQSIPAPGAGSVMDYFRQ